LESNRVIAIDAMGGDHAPDAVLRGANLARKRYPNTHFLLFGDEGTIEKGLSRIGMRGLRQVSTVRHAPEVVANEDPPVVALRQRRNSSMRLAINAVAEGEAECVVSAGNTGALMAMAKFVLHTLPLIDRPAIASFMPTARGESVMLDLGANIECDSDNLVQFAVLGEVFAATLLGIETPSVGLLNVGAEDLKGNTTLKDAAARLRDTELPIVFHGFVEGDDITAGTVDVIVTDGFTGNVALKTAEGTAKLLRSFFRDAFMSSFLARIGYLFAAGSFRKLSQRMDPRRYNGGVFLGLNGICVKSHGGTDAIGFANAVGLAIDMLKQDFNSKVSDHLTRLSSAGPRSGHEAAAG
jgi:glycerol-3-phosphate acyltransferase PlsX